MKPLKIVFIGAGSASFGRGFIGDVMLHPALAAGALALVDIDARNLEVMDSLARRMARQLAVPLAIESTTDRRRSLDGADVVVCTIEAPGGLEANLRERRISARYGVDQAIGCTTGLGGVFRTLRYAPVMLAICRDMEEQCPGALLLHYANPTSTVPWLLNAASPIRSVGMCHSVQGTARQLAGYLGAPLEETSHWTAGVNHQGWVLRFERNGRDAYPALRERMQDPAVYRRDIVRWEMMKHFGYFPTESSVHNSEYVPYFRKNDELIARFCPDGPRGVEHQERVMAWHARAREELGTAAHGRGDALEVRSTHEYPAEALNAIATGTPYRFNGNVVNTGLITNLPPGCCVEVPCLVDAAGVHPCFVGDLPPQCAALNRARIAGDELAVKAALELDRRAAFHAVALDPLTAALCTLEQIQEMVDETFEALSQWLPQFAGR